MDYAEYERVFNTGDDDLLVERFFCEDVRFSGGSTDRVGHAGLLDFLRWAHDGVREVMRPQAWVLDGDHLFAEVDMDFHARKERPDFPFGHLHPGDTVTVKFLVHYRLSRKSALQWKFIRLKEHFAASQDALIQRGFLSRRIN